MKKLLTIIILLVSIHSFSQDVVGDRVIAKQSLYVNGRWVDSIRIDTIGLVNDNRTLMTAGAIYKFVSNRIAGGGGSGTPGGSNGQIQYNNAGAFGGTTTGTGVLTALGVNTGSAGSFVVNGGALGTPSSGTLTNATGLPVSSGISGFGTGVATALQVNVGSTGAVVTFNGALGTPSSGTLTNTTGLPPVTGIVGWPANASGVLTNDGAGVLSWGAGGGGGTNNTNLGSFYRLVNLSSQGIYGLAPGIDILVDSATNANSLTIHADTTTGAAKLATQGFVTREIQTSPPAAYNVTYYAPNWGLVGDGVTDNSDAFNALFQEIKDQYYSNGLNAVTIQLDTGVYIVNGPMLDVTNANSQILLPNIPLDSPTLVITLRGRAIPPNQFFTTSVLPRGGFSTIKSTLTNQTGTASVISGTHEVGGLGAQNNVVLNVFDLICEVPPNPTISFFNLQYHQSMTIDNVLINAGSVDIDGISIPTNNNSYGIKFPEYNHTPSNIVGRLEIWGFYYGWRISERTDVNVMQSWVCKYTGELAFGNHSSTFKLLGSYWCEYGLKGTGTNTIRIMQYQMENLTSRGYDIDDPNNYITGDLVYQIIRSGEEQNWTFLKNGGANINCDSLGSVRHNFENDSSRFIQIHTGNYPPVGNYWLDTVVNRIKYYRVLPSNADTIVYTLAVQDSVIYSVPPPAPPTILIEDAFTDANGTNLTAHTIAPTNDPSATWVNIGGAITIESNKASTTPAAIINYQLESGESDCIIEATIQKTAGNVDGGIMFRYVDDANYWIADFLSLSGTVKIYEKTGGSFTERASISKTFSASTDYVMRVELSGDDITVTIDGGSSINYSSSVGATRTKHGFWTSGAGGVTITWDDFKISTQ